MRWNQPIPNLRPGRVSAPVQHAIARFVAPLVRVLFRPSLHGVEKLPSGPFVLVANHSGGLGIAEALCFAALFLRDTAGRKPLAPMVLPTNYFLPGNAQLVRALGAVPSTHAAGLAALREGVPVLVFPGGDHEALRPIWQANRVDFGGRTGFVRLAREAGVPVVPLGIRGGHWTAPSLLRSRLLAWFFVVPRLLGAKRWGISVLGLSGAVAIALAPLPWPVRGLLAWLWLSSPLTFWPIFPATIHLSIGAPIAVDELFPPREIRDEAQLARARDTVEHAVQSLVSSPTILELPASPERRAE